MKPLLLPILIALLLLAPGCEYFHQQYKVPTFSTPYGEIEKGASEAEVVAVLGIPQRIFSGDEGVNWYYNFGEDKGLFVYFMDGKVTRVRSKEDVEM